MCDAPIMQSALSREVPRGSSRCALPHRREHAQKSALVLLRYDEARSPDSILPPSKSSPHGAASRSRGYFFGGGLSILSIISMISFSLGSPGCLAMSALSCDAHGRDRRASQVRMHAARMHGRRGKVAADEQQGIRTEARRLRVRPSSVFLNCSPAP